MPYLDPNGFVQMWGAGSLRSVPSTLLETDLVADALAAAYERIEQAVRVAGFTVVSGELPDSMMLRGIAFRLAAYDELYHVLGNDDEASRESARADLTALAKKSTILPGLEIPVSGLPAGSVAEALYPGQIEARRAALAPPGNSSWQSYWRGQGLR